MNTIIPSERIKQISSYGATTAGMRNALRIAQLNPANGPLIYDLSSSEFAPTPFGAFLLQTSMVVEKILRRNICSGEHAHLTSADAHYWALELLGLKKLPAHSDPQHRNEDGYKASAEEIARLPELLTPPEITEIIDIFAWVSHAKEQRSHVEELVNAWRSFRSRVALHPVLSSLIPRGGFMSNLADNGIDAEIEKTLTLPSMKMHVANVLKIHEQCTLSYGIEPRTQQIKAILEKYRGSLSPIIIPYRKLDPAIVRAKREEFGIRNAEASGTKIHFLRSLNATDLRMSLYRLGFPLPKLEAMVKQGSFGQKSLDRNPHIITVEHMAPLTTGDNFFENFALATAGANDDLNRLVRYQTDFLAPDKVITHKNVTTWEAIGHTVDIIALRPPFLRYGNGQRFPSFIRHPGWDWKRG